MTVAIPLKRPSQMAPNPKPYIPLPALPVRERILVYGREGSGKTRSWVSIAEVFGTPIHVIDTDDAVARMLEKSDIKNITAYVPDGWAQFDKFLDQAMDACVDYVRNLKEPIKKEQLPWIVVDFADSTWDMVQNYYTEQVFDQGIDEFFLQARKQNRTDKKLQPLEGWTDWQVINKIFQSRWNSLTKGGGPFNLYLTARAVDIAANIDPSEKSLYKDLRKMPGGEKRMGGRVHTILMSSVDEDGWYLSTAKDRERPLLRFHKISNFAVNYLIKIAGWQP